MLHKSTQTSVYHFNPLLVCNFEITPVGKKENSRPSNKLQKLLNYLN